MMTGEEIYGWNKGTERMREDVRSIDTGRRPTYIKIYTALW